MILLPLAPDNPYLGGVEPAAVEARSARRDHICVRQHGPAGNARGSADEERELSVRSGRQHDAAYGQKKQGDQSVGGRQLFYRLSLLSALRGEFDFDLDAEGAGNLFEGWQRHAIVIFPLRARDVELLHADPATRVPPGSKPSSAWLGIPLAPGPYNPTAQVTDALHGQTQKTLTLTVR